MGDLGGWIGRQSVRPKTDWMSDSLELRCSFCGRPQGSVGKLVAGPTPRIAICDTCAASATTDMATSGTVCGFCGKPAAQVRACYQAGAADTSICDECVDLVGEIVSESLA